MREDPDDPIGALRAAVDALLGPDPGFTPVALGWATVDMDRAEAAFGASYPGAVTSVMELPDDALLGARCRQLVPGIAGVPAIVLLEPSTEGRLAAALARRGEGPAAIWLAATGGSSVAGSAPAPGPFGTEVLLLDGPAQGPYRLVVLVEAGTITP
jgi:hypothetical protein